MQDHELTIGIMADGLDDMTDEFEVRDSQLTDEGLDFYLSIENQWATAIKGRDYSEDLMRARDTKRFEKALKKIRGK